MHRPERLHAAIAHVSIHAKVSSLVPPQPFFPVFTAPLAAQFCLIFRKLACSFLASKMFEPACACLLVKSVLKAIYGARNAAALPRLNVNRPPLTPGLVLEMFWTHRRTPLQQRIRYGTTVHSRKVVQEPDAYETKNDGKIKRTGVRGSLRSQEVVCTLFFATCNGTLQGEGVPLLSLSRLFSTPKWVTLAMCGMGDSAVSTS
jgi:hypothetical protein